MTRWGRAGFEQVLEPETARSGRRRNRRFEPRRSTRVLSARVELVAFPFFFAALSRRTYVRWARTASDSVR